MNKTRKNILELTKKDPGITLHEVSTALNMTYSAARHHMSVLEKQGFVMKHQIRRKKKWGGANSLFYPQESYPKIKTAIDYFPPPRLKST